ncbi:hypothetical protein [Auraticoccus monumenti]|uniref:Cellulose synthase n=1 Tax=Auraticoccus monumenti TaxID=675864 RepID=A0A1G7CXM7_9ACTN|nr:hypothetical protein [Auraticoccus monumenti]SDE44204.1 hypothetical protein SAMN04489747_3418 [Auraticoccus monumenti]
MSPDTYLLPLCLALALIGLLATVVLWRSRRASRGRVLQGLAWTLAPVALYLTGLLRMVWDAVVTVARWAGQIVFSPTVWAGFSLLAVAVVLFVVGSLLVRRSHLRADPKGKAVGRGGATSATAATASGTGRQQPAVGAKQSPPAGGKKKAAASEDPEMDEIEALLKSRGIE